MKQRILLLMLLALFCTSCTTQSKKAIKENKETQETQETQEIQDFQQTQQDEDEKVRNFLDGTWVNELGFVCEFQEDTFVDQFGMFYEDFTITKYKNTDFYIMECTSSENTQVHKSVIQVIDDDTIKVDTVTAYRANCEKAQEYLENMKKNILGKWNYSCEEDEQLIEFTKNELITTDVEYEEKANYEFCDAKLLVCLGDEDKVTVYIQLKGDELTLREEGDVIRTYRIDRNTDTE